MLYQNTKYDKCTIIRRKLLAVVIGPVEYNKVLFGAIFFDEHIGSQILGVGNGRIVDSKNFTGGASRQGDLELEPIAFGGDVHVYFFKAVQYFDVSFGHGLDIYDTVGGHISVDLGKNEA